MRGRHWIDTALTYGYVVRRKIRFSSVCGLSNFVPIARYQLAIPELSLNRTYSDGDADLNNYRPDHENNEELYMAKRISDLIY